MCSLSTKMATASLLRCLGSVAAGANHSIHREFDLQCLLKPGGAFQAFLMALGSSAGIPSCALHWQKLVPNNFPLYEARECGDPGLCWRNWGHCTPCLGHGGEGAKNIVSADTNIFSPWLLCIINFSVINMEAPESIYLDFFPWFSVRCLIVLASVSLVPLVCKQSSPY